MERILLVGLEPHEGEELGAALAESFRVSAWTSLPPITVDDGQLFVPRQNGPGQLRVDRVAFHGVFADDMDFFAGLALWGGPCLPDPTSLLASRLKLPCLAKALTVSRFGAPKRGYLAPGATLWSDSERVAKWGNWHCGENKTRFTGRFEHDEACVIEPFLPGRSVRVAVLGEQAWQIELAGEDWKKSIHDSRAALESTVDPELLADTRALQAAFGLPWIACDYIVASDGQKYLLEVNAMPNVSRFPELWEAFQEQVRVGCSVEPG
jgi:D-ala D-ala ligase C-terminus